MSLSFEQVIEIARLVGLVSAGGWTAWTFYRLQTIQTAELTNNKLLNDIAKDRMDIEKSRIEIEKSRVDMEKGRTDTEKAHIDMEKSRIEQELMRDKIRSQQPQLAIDLEVSEERSPDQDYVSVLLISVVLKECGRSGPLDRIW